jgi:hypothetical protein
MKKQLAHKNVVPSSTSGSDEEEELVEELEEDAEQSIDGRSGPSFESKSSAAMFSKIPEMSCQLAKMMKMHRKQQLMAKKKPAQGVLSFDSPPPAKSSKLKSPFTPTRTAAHVIGATQAVEDSGRDSLVSQSSSTIARIRLQEKYVKVTTLYKDECTPEEIKQRIREIAFNVMVKSAIHKDLNPADRAFGGLKR